MQSNRQESTWNRKCGIEIVIPKPTEPFTQPSAALAVVVGWLTFRGLVWWGTGLGWLYSPLLLSSPLLDGLVGFMCLALARQLWVGIPGSTPPAILILLRHTTLYAYLLVFLRPEAWISLDPWTRVQVLVETGSATAMVLILLIKRPLRTEAKLANENNTPTL